MSDEKFLSSRTPARNVDAHTVKCKRMNVGYLKYDEPYYGSSVAGQTVTSGNGVDANQTITASQVQGGIYIRTLITAPRTDTLPTAAALLAEMGGTLTVGDTVRFVVANVSGQTLQINPAAGNIADQSATGRQLAAGEKREVLIRFRNVTAGAEQYEIFV